MTAYRADDLTPQLVPPKTGLLGFRQGVVVSWNAHTAENTIDVDGATLTNVPIINTSEALLLTTGAVVALNTWQGSWYIVGRITVPGTAEAATALAMVSQGISSAQVDTSESTTSTTYTDLATAGPTVSSVYITSSGRCLLMMSALMGVPTSCAAYMSCAISGATTLAATQAQRSVSLGAISSIVQGSPTCVVEVTGLNSGLHTFTAKYMSTSGGSCSFQYRNLTVVPF